VSIAEGFTLRAYAMEAVATAMQVQQAMSWPTPSFD